MQNKQPIRKKDSQVYLLPYHSWVEGGVMIPYWGLLITYVPNLLGVFSRKKPKIPKMI